MELRMIKYGQMVSSIISQSSQIQKLRFSDESKSLLLFIKRL